MNWDNLKECRCPKCGGYLNKNIKYNCTMCNFSISFGKFYDLVGEVDLEQMANKLLKKK